MSRKLLNRLAALSGAGLLALGGVALWFSADNGPAEATRVTSLPAAISGPDAIGEPLQAPVHEAPKSREEKRFARVDKDDDGRITQVEYLALRRRNFDKLDLNGDGRLGFEEYAVKGIEKFRKTDADHDGQLRSAEFATTALKPKSPQLASAKCACSTALASADGEGAPD